MAIRAFILEDYPELKTLYEKTGWFDSETDSRRLIERQIKRNPNSILMAVDDGKIVGSVTLLFTERLGLFFRLMSENYDTSLELLKRGEEIFKDEGYAETHIIVPLEDSNRQTEYKTYGFKPGKSYRWFWKKI